MHPPIVKVSHKIGETWCKSEIASPKALHHFVSWICFETEGLISLLHDYSGSLWLLSRFESLLRALAKPVSS